MKQPGVLLLPLQLDEMVVHCKAIPGILIGFPYSCRHSFTDLGRGGLYGVTDDSRKLKPSRELKKVLQLSGV